MISSNIKPLSEFGDIRQYGFVNIMDKWHETAISCGGAGPYLWISPEQPIELCHGPLTIYVKLRVAHAPGMPGTFSPPSTWKETASYPSQQASRHVRHASAVMHVGIANLRWWGKRSWHMRNLQLYVSGKRTMASYCRCTRSPSQSHIMMHDKIVFD